MSKHFSQSEILPIGLLGVGLVGSALAELLANAGYTFRAFDPAPESGLGIERLGGCGMASEAEVAEGCRRLLLSLPGPNEVRTVIARIYGFLRPGDVIIDTTTGEPNSVEAIARELEAIGVSYLDATLGGSSRQIASGEAIVIVGASDTGFAAAQDLLKVIGSTVFHTGGPGSGTRMKLVLNLVLGLQRAVLAEGLEFARSSGIDPERALEILKAGPAYAKVMDTKGHKMLHDDFHPEARLAQHWKDVRLMLESGRSNGAMLPLTRVHESLLRSASESGWGLEDNSAIIKVFQQKLQEKAK